MDFFYNNLDKICPDLTYCGISNCLLYHPRCFSGVCINFLNRKCDNKECRLKHRPLKDLKKDLKSPINGVYLINLCPHSGNCPPNQEQCQYLHKEWINKERVCLQNLDDECEQPNCGEKHISWDQLQKEAYQKYKKFGLYPEILCEEQNCSTDCRGHSEKLKQFCISYFKGTCKSKGKCQRIHIEWEDIKDLKPQQFFHKTLPPCTGLSENKNINVDIKFAQKLQVWFDKKLLKKLSKSIEEENIVDVIFIMDCTGSMSSWINAIQDNIINIIEKFKSVIKNYMVRIAFVGYRDIPDGDGHIVIHDFTADAKQIRNFILKQKASGGEDVAEDVAGALKRALYLDFSKHPDSILCTFLFCDAPTHGKQYHDIDSDNLKDNIPKGYLENIMKDFRKIKRNNFFTCCKITDQTRKMFEIMKKNFSGLEIAESSADQLPNQIAFTLIQSFKKSKLNSITQPNEKAKIRIAANYIRHKAITPIKCKKTGCPDDINYWANFLSQMGQNQIQGQTVLEIDIAPIKINDPEERGKCSYIFRVFDIRNNRNLIAKLPIEIVDSQKKQITQELELYAQRFVKVRYSQTLIAQQLANGYRRESRRIPNAPPIFYVSPIQYELQEQFYGVNHLYAETEIDLKGKWQKFSNNANYMKEGGQAYGAFSHLTYEWSNSQVMVTDLQGKQGIFSDPAIHTNYQALDELLLDQTNFNLRGMIQFMESQHPFCTILCKSLMLTRQQFSNSEFETFLSNETQDTNQSTDGYQEKKTMRKKIIENFIKLPILNLEKVNCICDICGNLFSINYAQYQNQKEDDYYCSYCTQDIERDDVCECCGEIFKYHHLQALRLGQIPTKCEYCVENCNIDLPKCVYCQKNCGKREIKGVSMGTITLCVCRLGRDYFESLQCSICLENFSYQEWPAIDAYVTGSYQCKDCLQKVN